ncbi:unnamed protein product [Scytosiphon promiscuus]
MGFAWQVIVVQTQGGETSINKRRLQDQLPLQITITYGDEKVSTPLVQASQPLWNFWTQLSDKGGSEDMVFSLVGRDSSSGSISVEGETRLPLSEFRRCGKSFELWEPLHPVPRAGGSSPAADGFTDSTSNAISEPRSELHLAITYCPSNARSESIHDADDPDMEETDCLLCTTVGIARGCSIS